MRLRAVLAGLPRDYELVRGRHGWLARARAAATDLERAGFGPEGAERLRPSDLSGRAPLGAIEAAGERWIVRRFHHGGFLRALGERCYLDPSRPFRELVLASRLQALGLPTPRVVAARARRSRPFGWQLALVSVRVENAMDGAEALERLRRGELERAQRQRLACAMGALVGRLHRAGFLHADLQPRNLLFARDLEASWILDLDRGRLRDSLAPLERRDNLRRLYRAVRRREGRARAFLTRTDYLRFLRAYARALGVPAEEGTWRADWRAIVRRDRRRAPLHRLGWALERLLGNGPEARDGAAAVPGRGTGV